jgi:hypothetical protein
LSIVEFMLSYRLIPTLPPLRWAKPPARSIQRASLELVMSDELLMSIGYCLFGKKLSLNARPSALHWPPALQAAAAHLLGRVCASREKISNFYFNYY